MSDMTLKPLKYKGLPGLSERQLAEHHDVLYAGYVKKTNEIREALGTADLASANGTYGAWRELKVEEVFAVNGVVLHERFFDNLTPGGSKPEGRIAEMIERDFGSLERWQEEMIANGLSSRGWVVLAYDLNEGRLRNYVCERHDQGGVWGAIPLLVLDVYEHAYFLDYATARKKYLEAFLQNIDWSVPNGVIEKYGLK
ncbi:MAG: Fe-Mn family superoxide dismutase [Patescibacteria group bacterium]|nr:Fe-Mn family superoxide dismutase [Patescibacteria group bacterium]